jgi:hypothetical protein
MSIDEDDDRLWLLIRCARARPPATKYLQISSLLITVCGRRACKNSGELNNKIMDAGLLAFRTRFRAFFDSRQGLVIVVAFWIQWLAGGGICAILLIWYLSW